MFSAQDVKALREKTGAGMMDCKKALQESNGNMDDAITWLREKGISKAAKKESRIAAEGLAKSLIKGNKAVILEVNSETDFVAKNENFQNFVNELAEIIIDSNAKTMDEALNLEKDGEKISDKVIAITSKIGEKISFRRFEVVEKTDSQNKKYTTFGYKKLMKLFKYLNKEVLNNKIKSYTLEMLVHQCIPTNRVDLKIWNAFSETLGNIAELKNIEDINDCCDSSKKGYDDKDKNGFIYFKEEINELYKKSLD